VVARGAAEPFGRAQFSRPFRRLERHLHCSVIKLSLAGERRGEFYSAATR
jgi:hypothetical protein